MPGALVFKEAFVQEWNVKPRRGRQRKYWYKVVNNLLGLDEAEWLEDISKGSCSRRKNILFLNIFSEVVVTPLTPKPNSFDNYKTIRALSI